MKASTCERIIDEECCLLDDEKTGWGWQIQKKDFKEYMKGILLLKEEWEKQEKEINVQT